jgi:hypothetical protein
LLSLITPLSSINFCAKEACVIKNASRMKSNLGNINFGLIEWMLLLAETKIRLSIAGQSNT